MVAQRPLTLALAFAASACSSTPPGATPDASTRAPDAGDAGVEEAAPRREILPYPPGPYGGNMGEVMPDFRIQGYALSRAEQDSTRLTYRDITLGEVRSDPACQCIVIVRNAIGQTCPPCGGIDRVLVRALASDPTLCAMEAVDANYDGNGPKEVNIPPTRADIDQYTQAGRQNFPVGILSRGGSLALTADAIGFVPSFFVVRAKDMRILGFRAGLPSNFDASVRTFCKDGPLNVAEPLATGISPRRLAVDPNQPFAYISDHNAGVLRLALASGPPTAIARPASTPDALALDAAYVYWATHDGGASFEIGRAPKAGGPAEVLTSGASGYLGLALDATRAYFTRADGVVASVPLGGGAPTTIASGESAPTGIAVDTDDVYWIESGSRSLVKAPKIGGARTVLLAGTAIPPDVRLLDVLVRDPELFVRAGGDVLEAGAVISVPKSGGPLTFRFALPGASHLSLDNAANLMFGSSVPDLENLGIVGFADPTQRTIGFAALGQRNVRGVGAYAGKIYWITNADDVRLNGGSFQRTQPQVTP